MQRRGEHWHGSPCFARPQVCASCGNERPVAFRDWQGQLRCSNALTRTPVIRSWSCSRSSPPSTLTCRSKRSPRRSRRPSPSRLTYRIWRGSCMRKPNCSPRTRRGRRSQWCCRSSMPSAWRALPASCAPPATLPTRSHVEQQRDALRICRNCFARVPQVRLMTWPRQSKSAPTKSIWAGTCPFGQTTNCGTTARRRPRSWVRHHNENPSSTGRPGSFLGR
jgi:hypothetical protein